MQRVLTKILTNFCVLGPETRISIFYNNAFFFVKMVPADVKSDEDSISGLKISVREEIKEICTI